ncbi:hypothetical protein MACH17_10300 [Phaeobacter inhibens]|nr:hypothetical protein MACH17_10300 [Phaeobacter inhibens]
MIAHPVDPARQADGLTDVGFVEFGAGMAAIVVHGVTFRYTGRMTGRAVNREMRQNGAECVRGGTLGCDGVVKQTG